MNNPSVYLSATKTREFVTSVTLRYTVSDEQAHFRQTFISIRQTLRRFVTLSHTDHFRQTFITFRQTFVTKTRECSSLPSLNSLSPTSVKHSSDFSQKELSKCRDVAQFVSFVTRDSSLERLPHLLSPIECSHNSADVKSPRHKPYSLNYHRYINACASARFRWSFEPNR